MLDALRRGASGWIAKIFLSILVLSFAVWGVADVFRGYGAGSLAKVGKIETVAWYEGYRLAERRRSERPIPLPTH